MNAVVSSPVDQKIAEQLGSIHPGSRVRLKSCKPTDQNSWHLVTSLIHNAAGELAAVVAIPMPNAIYHHPLDDFQPGKAEVLTLDRLADAENIWQIDTSVSRITFLPTGQIFEIADAQIYEVDEGSGRITHPYGATVTRSWRRALQLYRIVASTEATVVNGS